MRGFLFTVCSNSWVPSFSKSYFQSLLLFASSSSSSSSSSSCRAYNFRFFLSSRIILLIFLNVFFYLNKVKFPSVGITVIIQPKSNGLPNLGRTTRPNNCQQQKKKKKKKKERELANLTNLLSRLTTKKN